MFSDVLRPLKRLYSEPPSLDSTSLAEAFPAVSTHVLLESEEVPTPETRDMSFSEFYTDLDAPVHQTRPVYTVLLDDVFFCPTNHVITSPSREVIRESAGPGRTPFGVNEEAILHPGDINAIEGICTTFRCLFDNYYHLLIDHLSRFDLLNQPFFSRYENINLLCPGGLRPEEEFFVSKMVPSNVTVVPLEQRGLYRPETYLFLSFPTRRASAYIPGPYVERLRSRTLQRRSPDNSRRLYISRRNASARRVRNEEALMNRLRPLGFQRYDLETYSLPKQIQLFEEAEFVVAPHGAGLSNLLFSKNTKVLELHPSPTVATHFYLLCKRMGHNYHYRTHQAPNEDSDFTADPDLVSDRVTSLLP
jgi:hypothetical protein